MEFYEYVCNKLGLSISKEIRICNDNTEISLKSSKGKWKSIWTPILLLFPVVITFFTIIFLNYADFFEEKKVNVLSLIIAMIIGIIIAFIKNLLFIKVNTLKPKNTNIYNRELPSNLTPAHVQVLLTKGNVDSRSLAATIFDLIDKGYLELETEKREDLFTKDIYITKTNKSRKDLFDYEKYVLDWLFTKEKMTSVDVRKKIQEINNNPCENFAMFQALVLISFPYKKYFKGTKSIFSKSKNYYEAVDIVIPVLGIIWFISSAIFNLWLYTTPIWILLVSILFSNDAFDSNGTTVYNEEGTELADNYLDLKKFLEDFSIINQRSAKEIVIWDFYLSYSIVLKNNAIAYDEISKFFGNNIYIQNDDKVDEKTDKEDLNMLLTFDKQIKEAEEIYKRR